MNVLSILAGQSKDFTFELFDKFNTNLNTSLHTLHKIDLYTEKFNPVFVSELAYSDEIIKYQNLVKISDLLVFFYPVWEFGLPAILKGFLDKVFQEGFAYEYDRNYTRGLLSDKKGMIFSTSRQPNWQLRFLYGNVLPLTWKRGVFGSAGIRDVRLQNFDLIGGKNSSERQLLALEEIKLLAGEV